MSDGVHFNIRFVDPSFCMDRLLLEVFGNVRKAAPEYGGRIRRLEQREQSEARFYERSMVVEVPSDEADGFQREILRIGRGLRFREQDKEADVAFTEFGNVRVVTVKLSTAMSKVGLS
jgi:hypothetical protein